MLTAVIVNVNNIMKLHSESNLVDLGVECPGELVDWTAR